MTDQFIETPPPSDDGFVETSPPKEKSKEAAFDLRYLPAGALKNITLAPALAGLVGAAYETAGQVPNNPFDWEWDDIKKKFVTNAAQGKDADLIKFGTDLTTKMTDAMGIEERPTRTANQIMDITGTFVLPVPVGFLGGPTAKGVLGTLGRGVTLLASPVRMGPRGNLLNRGIKGQATFAQRAGASAVIGGSLDQAIRYGVDEPMLLSEEALTGEAPDGFVETVPVSDEFVETSANDIDPANPLGPNPQMVADDQAVQDEADSQRNKQIAIAIAAALSGVAAAKYITARNSALAGPSGFDKDPIKRQTELSGAIDTVKQIPTIGGKVKKSVELLKNRGMATVGRQFNSQVTIDQALRAAGVKKTIIDQLDGQGLVDSRGQIIQWLKTGQLAGMEEVTTPMKRLKHEFDLWSPEKQQGFVDFITAGQSNFVRIKATAIDYITKLDYKTASGVQKNVRRALVKALNERSLVDVERILDAVPNTIRGVRGTGRRVAPDLWEDNIKGKRQTLIEDDQLRATLEAGLDNPDYVRMRKLIAENNAAILDNAVERGVLDADWAAQVKRQFTVDNELLYVPGKSEDELGSIASRLMKDMGLFSSNAKNMRVVGNLSKQAEGEFEGIGTYLDPFNSSAHYSAEMLDHTNRSVAQMNILREMLGFDFDDAGNVIFREAMTPQGVAMRVAREKAFFTKLPKYIGRISPKDPNNVFGGFNLRYYNDKLPEGLPGKTQGEINALKGELNSTDAGVVQKAVEQLQELNNALMVQHKGDFHLFNIEDRFLKEALEFDTRLTSRLSKANNFLKRTMTAGTTGHLSAFGPTSFIYNGSIGSINKFIRSEGGLLGATQDAINVWRDGVRGAMDIFATHVANDFADLITHTLETGVGFGSSNPAMLKALRTRLIARAKKTMMTDIVETTGSVGSSGVATSEFRGNLNNVMHASVPHIYKAYGANALPQFARIWTYFNSAMHEGVALGATIRRMKETGAKTANEIRMARKAAADLVGNTKLQGSSRLARELNASVPFYGAMLQAFYTLGKAYHKAGPVQFGSRMALAVGLPAALEIAYNSSLDTGEKFPDASGRMWSYHEFYWKGFSPDQRANNNIVFKPGFPPWEAVIVPIVPELGVFKGMALDAIDAIFGFSGEHNLELDHARAGYNRVFNIPTPIIPKVAGTWLGQNIRLGPQFDEDGFHLIDTQAEARGNRVTPDDQVRFEGQEIDTTVVNILNDVFGSLGRLLTDLYENFNAGGVDTPIENRVEASVDSLAHNIQKQFRISTGLFSSHPNLRAKGDPSIHQRVFKKKEAIRLTQRNIETIMGGGKIAGGFPVSGTDTQEVPLDPITRGMAFAAKQVEGAVKPYEEAISRANTQISSLKTSLYNNIPTEQIPKGPISVAQRDALIDAYALQIDYYKREILSIYTVEEIEFGKKMSAMLGRPVTDFTFDGYVNRPNPSSTSQGLRK